MCWNLINHNVYRRYVTRLKTNGNRPKEFFDKMKNNLEIAGDHIENVIRTIFKKVSKTPRCKKSLIPFWKQKPTNSKGHNTSSTLKLQKLAQEERKLKAYKPQHWFIVLPMWGASHISQMIHNILPHSATLSFTRAGYALGFSRSQSNTAIPAAPLVSHNCNKEAWRRFSIYTICYVHALEKLTPKASSRETEA